ncbi:MAG: hypothetical protein ACXVMS_07060 [Flavisolibacter sp.]
MKKENLTNKEDAVFQRNKFAGSQRMEERQSDQSNGKSANIGHNRQKNFYRRAKKTSLGGGSRVQEVLAALGENPLVADKNGGGYFLIVD